MNLQPEIVQVRHWYDRHSRSWVVQKLDAEGSSVQSAYFGTKSGRDSFLAECRKEHPEAAVVKG